MSVEVVVVDDCSEEDTRELIHSYPSTAIKYLRNAQRKGAPFAVQEALQGIPEALGESVIELGQRQL